MVLYSYANYADEPKQEKKFDIFIITQRIKFVIPLFFRNKKNRLFFFESV